MITIPFREALRMLNAASSIEVHDHPCAMTFYSVDMTDRVFLEIEADDSHDNKFRWVFDTKENREVKVEGNVMTLIADGDEANESGPVDLLLMVPMELETTNPVVTCVYCGHQYPDGTPTHQADVLTEHIKQCEKHPIRSVMAELADVSARLDRIYAFANRMDESRDGHYILKRQLIHLTQGNNLHGKPYPKPTKG